MDLFGLSANDYDSVGPTIGFVETPGHKKPARIARAGPYIVVGARRFELPTPCTPCRCATRLRYAPTEPAIIRVHGRSGRAQDVTDFRKLLPQVGGVEVRFEGCGHHGCRAGQRTGGGARFIGLGLEPVPGAIDREALFVK